MFKKLILSNIKSILLFLHNRDISFKKLHCNKKSLGKLLEFVRSGRSDFNSFPPQKEFLNYITSRNMGRILRPSDLKIQDRTPTNQTKADFFDKKETFDSLSLIFKKSKYYFMMPVSPKISKFHSNTMLLGNIVSKQFTKKETQEELELSWGGPDIFKLITFIKNFEEIMQKHTDVLVFFSAYWCQHCMRLRKPFGSAALMAKEANLPVLFATFDVTTDPEVAVENGIVGIPLIKYYKGGKYVSTYKGKRTAEDLFEFVKNPPAPVIDLKKPDI